MKPITAYVAPLALFAALSAPARAQDEDPRAKIKELAQKVADELQNVDRLLLQRERGSQQGAREAMERARAGIQKLLDESKQGQQEAAKGIDELIAEIQKMQSKSSQSSESSESEGSQQSQRPPNQESSQQQREQGQRDQTQTPDHIRQDGQQPKPGEQKPDPHGEPKGNQPEEGKGQQVRGGKIPESETERTQRDGRSEEWGGLPKYLQFLQGRGGLPEVPEKYRKFLEAYMKQSAPAKDGRK